MGVHEEIKKMDYSTPTSCIIPLIALNQYVWSKTSLTPERINKAAKIAAELAQTCGKYDSSWAKEQLEYVPIRLREFLEKASGTKGIEKELDIVRTFLAKGSPELDMMKAKDAFDALLKMGGDEGVEKCRRCILEITDPEIRKQAIEKCQEYWNMYWFGDSFRPVLFSAEFMLTLEKMEVLKN
jgi:hypothetical protein